MVTVEYQTGYAADVAFVHKTLTDPAFLDAYAEQIGALRWEADAAADGTTTRLQMTVPTTAVPAAFKRFVTPTVEIVETRAWDISGPSYTGPAAVDAAVGKREVRIRGVLALVPGQEGCTFIFRGEIAVNLRFVGDAAALLIRDLIRSVLAQQTKVMQRWIDGSSSPGVSPPRP